MQLKSSCNNAIPLATIGADNVQTGLRTMRTREHQSTLLFHGVKSVGERTGLYGYQGASSIELLVNLGTGLNPKAVVEGTGKAILFGYRSAGSAIKGSIPRAPEMFPEVALIRDPVQVSTGKPITLSYNASNANARVALNRKMRDLQKAQKTSVKTEKFSDGRIRYYARERLSKELGQTRGSSYVTEHNPNTGQVRSWMECYDHAGNVNRVHPKMIDGQNIIGQHYPPTGSELKLFVPKPGGNK